jgi:ribonuclease-3
MSEINQKISDFEDQFRVTFSNKKLLEQAFKHRSYLTVSQEDKIMSNERLEFLGDAVLETAMSEFLFLKYPNLTEGELSKKKAILVSKNVLGEIGKELELGKYLLLNYGEEKTGGRKRLKLIADLFEAILGAFYLEFGFEKTKKFIEEYLISHHLRFETKQQLHNFKSELLEKVQSTKNIFPVYKIIEETGPDHDKNFVVEVSVEEKVLAKGEGKNKKQAEQIAAKYALEGKKIT